MSIMIDGGSCNHCGKDLGEVDERVLSVVCPHCNKATGVCANCHWWIVDITRCDNCTYNKGETK